MPWYVNILLNLIELPAPLCVVSHSMFTLCLTRRILKMLCDTAQRGTGGKIRAKFFVNSKKKSLGEKLKQVLVENLKNKTMYSKNTYQFSGINFFSRLNTFLITLGNNFE